MKLKKLQIKKYKNLIEISICQSHSITHSVHFPARVSQRRCGRSRVIARQSALLHTAANSQAGLLF